MLPLLVQSEHLERDQRDASAKAKPEVPKGGSLAAAISTCSVPRRADRARSHARSVPLGVARDAAPRGCTSHGMSHRTAQTVP
jgi:hypothetical protein